MLNPGCHPPELRGRGAGSYPRKLPFVAVKRTNRVQQRKTLLAILGVLSAALLYGILFGNHGIRQFLKLSAKLEQRSAEAHSRIVRNRLLLEHRNGLETDKRVLEQVARTRLGVAGEDEVVFVFRSKPHHR